MFMFWYVCHEWKFDIIFLECDILDKYKSDKIFLGSCGYIVDVGDCVYVVCVCVVCVCVYCVCVFVSIVRVCDGDHSACVSCLC